MEIPSRLETIRDRVESACRRVGRSSKEITLVAVSKTRTVQEMAFAVAAGVRDLGENRVQEAEAKHGPLMARVAAGDVRPRWHLVGHLQRNKVKKAVVLFDRIHSLDSYELGARIDRAAEEAGKMQPSLLQVDLASEATKFGLPEGDLFPTLEKLAPLSHLRIEGLMVLPPFLPNPEEVRPYFQRLRELGAEVERRGLGGRELSMGMSHDFEIAIEEGATFIRVGEAIFGPRGTIEE